MADMPTLKTARPRAQLRQGRNDWYRIENNAGTGTASVYIYDEIGYWGVTAADFVAELSELTGVAAIDLHLNSPGGEVFEGLAIMNCLRSHPATVTTYVDGIAASIASVIAMAGDRIVMGPHSQLMIHEGSGLCVGDAAEMRKMADLLDFQSNNIAGVYQARAGGTVEEWRAFMVAETWYTAEEAVRVGLADEVAPGAAPAATTVVPGEEEAAEQEAMANSWDLSIYRYKSRAEAPAPVIKPSNRAPAPTPVAPGGAEPTALTIDIGAALGQQVVETLRAAIRAEAQQPAEAAAPAQPAAAVEPEPAPDEVTEPETTLPPEQEPAEPELTPEQPPEPAPTKAPQPAAEPPADQLAPAPPAIGEPEATKPPTAEPVDAWATALAHLTTPAPDAWSAALAHLTAPSTSPSAATHA